jgi:rhamnosyltransferase subunit B
MNTILIGWELGANRGHVVKLGAIAARLRARGCEIVFAVQRPDALRAVRAEAEQSIIYQAPVWPGILSTGGFRPLPGHISYGDLVADMGMRDSGVVEYLIRAWDSLLATVKPAAIVAEFAPALQMAARGRVRTVATGTGFTVPPSTLESFPSLDERFKKPGYDESTLLKIVNRAAERTGRPGYDRLPQIAAADAAMPAVFRELDPYAEVRVEAHIAPFLGSPPPVRETSGDEIFVYLGEVTLPDSPLLGAIGTLARQGHRVRAYLPLLDPEKQAELTAAGAELSPEPVPLADIARRSRIAVTNGGLGLASSALACGLPLAVLPTDLEKMLNGRALERIGIGRSIAIKDAGRPKTADEIAGAVADAAGDAGLAQRATELAPGFRKRLERNPADAVADMAMELAGPG